MKYPMLLAVACDHDDCENEIRGDFLVDVTDDRATRLGYALDHAVSQGWQVELGSCAEAALTFCPQHFIPPPTRRLPVQERAS